MPTQFLKSILITLSIVLTQGLCQAGGVGSGGGGITNPDPANATEIAQAMSQDARVSVEMWLNRQEKNFWEQSPQVRAQNPLRKLFEVRPGAIQLLKTTGIELRMSQPCYDSAHNPLDGSIYGTKPGSLCLSPYSMAPKLSHYNFKAESFALLVHELSHVLGTSEAEAVEIQKIALKDFFAKDVEDLKHEAQGFIEGLNNRVIPFIDTWSTNPGQLNHDQFVNISRDLQDAELAFNSDGSRYLLVSREEDAFYAAEYVRADILNTYYCAHDGKLPDFLQKACADKLIRAFAGAPTASIETITKNLSIVMDRLPSAVASRVSMQNPTSWNVVGSEMLAIKATVIKIRNSVAERISTPLNTYTTP